VIFDRTALKSETAQKNVAQLGGTFQPGKAAALNISLAHLSSSSRR
jgi:hypothetical protein